MRGPSLSERAWSVGGSLTFWRAAQLRPDAMTASRRLSAQKPALLHGIGGAEHVLMPFRDGRLALQEKLNALRAQRDALDAEIAQKHAELGEVPKLFTIGDVVVVVCETIIVAVLIVLAVCLFVLFLVASCPREHSLFEATRTDAHTLAGAAELYLAQYPSRGCPTTEELVAAGVMNPSQRTTDAWDHPFAIECGDEGVVVTSIGLDGQAGTEDDISSDQTASSS
jgi:hypothetical protein